MPTQAAHAGTCLEEVAAHYDLNSTERALPSKGAAVLHAVKRLAKPLRQPRCGLRWRWLWPRPSLVFCFLDLPCQQREVLVANMAEVEMFICYLVIHIDVFLSKFLFQNIITL